MGLTENAAKFIAGIGGATIPDAAVRIARTGFIDCTAVIFAGWGEAPVEALLRVRGLRVPALAPFQRSDAPVSQSALIHAAAAHVHDWDDTALSGHPSAVLVPAILAEAAARPVSGRRMIEAYVAGYELWAELILREPDPLHGKGWHPSATIGTPAVAAAVSVLRGVSSSVAQNALALSASMTGGVLANFGTPAKCWQLARAAESGIVAVDLAEAGLSGAPDALEHPNGLLAALSPNGRADLDRRSALGNQWRIVEHGLNLKMYPVCYAMHRMLDAASELKAEHAPDPDDIQSIVVEIGDTQARMLRSRHPQTALDAKFSVEFGAAAMLIAGRCGRSELTDDFIRCEDIQALMRRVVVRRIPERLPEDPAHSPWDRVTLEMLDGTRRVSRDVTHPLGHFRNPAPPSALHAKFLDGVGDRLDTGDAERLFKLLERLETVGSSTELFDALGPRRSCAA